MNTELLNINTVQYNVQTGFAVYWKADLGTTKQIQGQIVSVDDYMVGVKWLSVTRVVYYRTSTASKFLLRVI